MDVDPDGRFAVEPLATADVLVVLHARRSASVARHWRAHRGAAPMVVALAGTDLYRDMPDDASAMASVEAADRLVVLQAAAIERLASLADGLAEKATVIYQSVERPLPERRIDEAVFRVVVIAHLRAVKDPLLCARAARLLPRDSTVVIDHAGAAHSDDWHRAATTEMADNPRYRWLGPLDRADALRLVAGASLLACTSVLEGGANVVTEAIALGVPVIGTDIDGNRGLLGSDYPALVPVGDEARLATLMRRLETDRDFLADLQQRIDARRPITEVAHERAAWADLLASSAP